MASSVDLKPNERVVIGDALITNDGVPAHLDIEGSAPVLRERDVVRAQHTDTPCKTLCVAVQMIAMDRDCPFVHDQYFALVREIQDAAPSTTPMIFAINENIIGGTYDRALEAARNLIAYEAELIANA